MTPSNKKQQVVEERATELDQLLCPMHSLINLVRGSDFPTPTPQYSPLAHKLQGGGITITAAVRELCRGPGPTL